MREVSAPDNKCRHARLPTARTTGALLAALPVPKTRPTRSTHRALGVALLALGGLAAPAAQAGKCTIARFPDIAVTMRGFRPMVHAELNGKDALFIADSGAFFSDVTPRAVQEFQMHFNAADDRVQVQGVGGRHQIAQVAVARTFALAGIAKTWQGVEFVVAGSIFGDGEAAGLLGQNVFRIADVEYDLANGVIRLVRPQGDCKNTPLAYWAADAQKPYSVIDIQTATAAEPHTKSVAYLNGAKIRVTFDTGATQSLLTLAAAKRAGVTPTSEGVIAAGASSWITRFHSFKIGDEQIEHALLRFGDIDLLGADMLIGADFFLSHRIYVATSQNKLYFTYNGGPVFDLSPSRTTTQRAPADAVPRNAAPGGAPTGGTAAEGAASGAAAGGAAAGAATAGAGLRPGGESQPAAPTAPNTLDMPTDAAGYARRGAASASRRDYDSAIADLTRACELAPAEASYFYQRGMAYWDKRQADPALADFDQAIRLKPDDAEALLARGALHNVRKAPAEVVVADLEAADRASSNSDDLHLNIGHVYEAAGKPAAAVVQYSKWIDSHGKGDTRMPVALNARCWARALGGQELEQALLDCNAALKMRPNTAQFLDSRGMVYLRQSNYDKAIADYDAALKLRPKVAWSLYGRGLAKSRKGLTAEGQADIAAATALEPTIAEQARKFGIAP